MIRKFILVLSVVCRFFCSSFKSRNLNSKAMDYILQRTLVRLCVCYLGYIRNAEQAALDCAVWSEFLRLREL